MQTIKLNVAGEGWSVLERTWKGVGIVDLQPRLECGGEALLDLEGQLASFDEGPARFNWEIAFRVDPAGYRVRLEPQVVLFLHHLGEVYMQDWVARARDPEVRHHPLALRGLEVAVRVAVLDGLFAFGELLEAVLGVGRLKQRVFGLVHQLLHFVPHFLLLLGHLERVGQDGRVLSLVPDGVLEGEVRARCGFGGECGLRLPCDQVRDVDGLEPQLLLLGHLFHYTGKQSNEARSSSPHCKAQVDPIRSSTCTTLSSLDS